MGGRLWAKYRFNAVCVVNSEFRIMGSLDRFIDDTVYDSKSVEFKLDAINRSIGDFLVLFVEMIEELGVY